MTVRGSPERYFGRADVLFKRDSGHFAGEFVRR